MERMDDFFAARVGDYDEHMLSNVEGCKEAYQELVGIIPAACRDLLDLGCGTGLELDPLFQAFPGLHVTGIDMTQTMLRRCREKYPRQKLRLICGDYFELELGRELYDCAISFESLHHFAYDAKRGLYQRIHDSLRPGGRYIECDYMVDSQQQEDAFFEQRERLVPQLGLSGETHYHFDTPCTVNNQISMLLSSGFERVDSVFRMGDTVMLVADKR